MVTTWTNAAKRDLQQIHQRLAAADPVVASSTIEAILAGTDQLHENYQSGKPEALLSGEKVPYKYINVGYYKILYTFNAEKVSIRSVFHLRQMAEQNQALISQLDVKAAEVAAKEAAKMATATPTPEPVVETPVVPETPVVEETVTTDTTTVEPSIQVEDSTTTVNSQVTDTLTEESIPGTEETSSSTMGTDLEALRAKMSGGSVNLDSGEDSGFDADALAAELMEDDEKEKEEMPEVKDFSIDNLEDGTKPEGSSE